MYQWFPHADWGARHLHPHERGGIMRRSMLRFIGAHRAVAVVAPLAAGALLVAVPATGAMPGSPAGHAHTSATQQRLGLIATKVDGLIRRMTLAEKFGQLEMSGPTGANGGPGKT